MTFRTKVNFNKLEEGEKRIQIKRALNIAVGFIQAAHGLLSEDDEDKIIGFLWTQLEQFREEKSKRKGEQ